MAERDVDKHGVFNSRVEELLLQQRELSSRLRLGQDQFKRLARSVWMVQEQERRKLARELHDGLGQNLTVIINLLGMALSRPDPAGEYVEKARELAEMTLRETRELSKFLRPTMLDDLGLEPALRWLARTMAEANNWQILVDLPDPMPQLDGDLSTLVFRAFQEGLTNAAKYARAKHVDMSLQKQGRRLYLTVADDGQGSNVEASAPSETAQGSGLVGLRDRVRAYDGELHVESAPGRGFRISMDIPLPPEGGAA